MRLRTILVSLGYLLSLAFGYRMLSAANAPPDPGLRRTILILECGENALASSSVGVRQVLNGVVEALPDGTQEFARNDIMLFFKAFSGYSSRLQCGREFLRYRARQELARVEDKLLNTSPHLAGLPWTDLRAQLPPHSVQFDPLLATAMPQSRAPNPTIRLCYDLRQQSCDPAKCCPPAFREMDPHRCRSRRP